MSSDRLLDMSPSADNVGRERERPSSLESRQRNRFPLRVAAIAQVLTGLLVLFYPVAVYYGLTRFSVRRVAPLLLLAFLMTTLLRIAGFRRDKVLIKRSFTMLGAIALMLALAMASNHRVFILTLPAAINLIRLWGFAGSLRSEVSLVERFALMLHPDLSTEEHRYCRRVTVIWSIFFVINGSIALALSFWGTFFAWTLYNGFIAYLLIGALAGGEFIYRKYRFRRYSNKGLDRVFRLLFPS
jgi:uncharacterized membrane protein